MRGRDSFRCSGDWKVGKPPGKSPAGAAHSLLRGLGRCQPEAWKLIWHADSSDRGQPGSLEQHAIHCVAQMGLSTKRDIHALDPAEAASVAKPNLAAGIST